jgi:thiol-disulfide isomerase/thioredoxin
MPEIAGPVRAPELTSGLWLQGPRVSVRSGSGRVVLLDFWEASCVYCVRTLPYLRAWHERYAGRGLDVVGVHTPEFDFTAAASFVGSSIRDLDLPYPVLLDTDRAIWSAYANKVWPAKYLIDARGYLRFEQFGAGGYELFEEWIQRLLHEAGDRAPMPPILRPLRPEDASGAVCHRPSAELYVGFHRGGLVAAEGYRPGEVVFHAPEQTAPEAGSFVASGRWLHQDDYLEACEIGASLLVSCEASTVHMVAEPEGFCRVEVDGAPVAAGSWGRDLRAAGDQTVAAWERPRLVEILDAPDFTSRLVRITALEPGLRVYTFTFGGCLREAS